MGFNSEFKGLILCFHLQFGLPWGLFPSGFHTKTLYAYLFPHTCHMPCPNHPPLFEHPNNWWGKQHMKLLIMQFSPFPCYLVPLNPKCLPQHPILRHPLPMFLPHCDRPSFTLMQNNRQSYSAVQINQPTRCNNFSSLLLDVYVQLNMFRASSRP